LSTGGVFHLCFAFRKYAAARSPSEVAIRRARPVPESFSPAYRRPMSAKHINTAADLVRFGAGLKIECGSCGVAKTLDGVQSCQIGGGRSLAELQPRLRCERCGERAAKLTILPPV
jgi:hypothetical protein